MIRKAFFPRNSFGQSTLAPDPNFVTVLSMYDWMFITVIWLTSFIRTFRTNVRTSNICYTFAKRSSCLALIVIMWKYGCIKGYPFDCLTHGESHREREDNNQGQNEDTLYDKIATTLGNSAKVDGPARFSGKRWHVIILNDLRPLYQHPRFQATFRI